MREKSIEAYFCKRAEQRGWMVRKIAYVGIRGCPDRLVIRGGGRVFFVEFKNEKGRLSISQVQEIEKIRSYGVSVLVIDSKKGVDDFFNG